MVFCCEICGQEFNYDGKFWNDGGGHVHEVCETCNEMLMFDFGKDEQPPARLFKY